MFADENTNDVWVHLYGGEQDGWRKQIKLKTKVPKRFYIWHVKDEKTIEGVKGTDQKVLQSRLATMAYELYEDISEEGKRELRYRRLESADKPLANPAR